MSKLYLTSSKIDGLLDFLSDSPGNTSLAFTPTAGNPYDDHSFVEQRPGDTGNRGYVQNY